MRAEANAVHNNATPLARQNLRPDSHECGIEAFVADPQSPISRANSFPKVTNLICRLPLSTLFYQLEATHLGDLLRIWVRPSEKFIWSHLLFHGPHEAHKTSQKTRCFTTTTTISPAEPIPWSCEFKSEKRSLTWTSSSVRRFVCVTAPLYTQGTQFSSSRCRNVNLLPFRPSQRNPQVNFERCHFKPALACALGPTNPRTITVHAEPFSTSVFKDLT